MIVEKFKPKGTVTLVLHDAEGHVKETRVENMIVGVGLAYIASRMKDAAATVMSHMAIGSGVTAAATGNIELGAELARVALGTTTLVTTTATNDSIQYTASFGAGVGTGSVTEAGVLNAASAGTLLARTVFGVITKGASDTLSITWKIAVTSV